MFFVYALYSSDFDKIYIGYTSDIEARLIAHNHPNNKGWTKKYQPWVVIYTESYACKADALKREKQLKTAQGRLFVRNLIP